MRILLVTDNRFWREELGSQRRISSLCSHLICRDHSVDVLFQGFLYPQDSARLGAVRIPFTVDSLGHRDSPPPGAPDRSTLVQRATTTAVVFGKRIAKQIIVDAGRWHRKSLPSPDSVRRFDLQAQEPKLADFADPKLLERFREACRRIQPQVVIVEYVRLAFLLQDARDALPRGCLTLIDTHDVQHERQSRFHANRERHDIDITPTEEAAALSVADAVIAIQPTDALKFSRLLPEQRVIVAGFPSDIHDHPPREAGARPVRIGFFGSDMLPNCDVVRSLVGRYFPPLRTAHGSDVELHIFGAVCNAFPVFKNLPGITLHGFVADLKAAYASLDLIANPVAFGGGLKIKNVEALCHGRPLITTPIGAEGLEKGANGAFLVAEDDDEFAALLASVVGDEDRRKTLAAAARDFAHENLSEEAVYAELDNVLEQPDIDRAAPSSTNRGRMERRARTRLQPVAGRTAAWYVTNPDPRRAGLRYRCLYPMLALRHKGWNVQQVNSSETVADTVVFDAWSLFPTEGGGAGAEQVLDDARRLKDRGVRIVLDNSDNLLVNEAAPAWQAACAKLRALAACADTVVACSDYLADAMRQRCRLPARPEVIGDPAEDEIRFPGDSRVRAQLSINRKINWLRYLQHRLTIQDEIRSGRTPLVWFGHHGNAPSDDGMLSLLTIQEQLERLNRRHPVSLTIISNHPDKFTHKLGHWQIPMHYLDWDHVTFLAALRLHTISLIPTPIDEYSSAKSANRVVLSLLHGLNVVCDPIPSYREFASTVAFGNWQHNLDAYITHSALRRFHVKTGREFIRTRYSLPVVAEQWAQLLFAESLSERSAPATSQDRECA